MRVGVASSLTPRMPGLATAFGEAHGVELLWVAGPSGRVANQAAAGAGYDAVVLAVPEATVAEAGAASTVVGRNTLAVVKRRGLPSRWVLAETSTVPLGVESRRALTSAGRWPEVAPVAVYAGSAAQVVAWLRAGEADAGVVYASDVPTLGAGWSVEPLPGGVAYVVRASTDRGAVFAAWLEARRL